MTTPLLEQQFLGLFNGTGKMKEIKKFLEACVIEKAIGPTL